MNRPSTLSRPPQARSDAPHADSLLAGLTWVAYPHTNHATRTRNAHAVKVWEPGATAVVAVCGRILSMVHQLKHGSLTLTPQPHYMRCGFCVERLGRTQPAAVPEYRPR